MSQISRCLTKNIGFAFGTDHAIANQQYTGTAIVNVPFKVKTITVREMFTSPLRVAAQVVNGAIGGQAGALSVGNPLVTVGMSISGTNVVGIPVVTTVQSTTAFITDTFQAVPATVLTFSTSLSAGASIDPGSLTSLTIVTANPSLVVGQTVSGIGGFLTCTITAIVGLTLTLSLAQAAGIYDYLYASTTGTGSVSGVVVAFTGVLNLSVGATVAGTGVTGGTVVTNISDPFVAMVTPAQAVPRTALTFTNLANDATLTENVLVTSLDGLFPPQSALGVVNIGTDLIGNYVRHGTTHVFDEAMSLRGMYSVKITEADGFSPPVNKFTGYLSCVCEFRSD